MLTATLILLAMAGAGCLYALLAARLVWRDLRAPAATRAAGPRPAVEPRPGVSLLKPLHGDEPDLGRNLRSACLQDYRGPVEVIFGVADPEDPAAAAAERLRAELPAVDIRVVVDGRRHGTNGKVSNLANMLERARHPVIVFADSDMLVGPDYLGRVVAALEAPGVGAVTCLYRGVAVQGAGRKQGLWSRLAVGWIDHHFLPGVVVGMALGMAKPCFGSTIALTRDTLDRIGGFLAFKDRLADDYAVGEAVRALGLAVAVPPNLVLGHTCATASLGALLRQEVRWARTIRSVDPAGFAGSAVTYPVPLATLALFASAFAGGAGVGAAAWAVLAAAVASRLLLRIIVDRALDPGTAGTKGLILGLVRDYAAFVVFVLAFWPGSIDWRGHRFALQTDGSMTPKTAPPKAGS